MSERAETVAMAEPHLIVGQMNPSDEQMPAVLARGRDVVVTAGAGTGKTRTLVARYLSLLAEGLPLRTIVAITFTRKAAREMRNRVRDEMRRYLARPELAPQERRRWQRLYSELDAARIGTIHSLCTEILRAHPAEAAVDPRFEVLGEGQTNVLQGQAVDEALAWAAENEPAVSLFALLGEFRLRPVLAAMMQQRLAVEDVFARLPADPLAAWGRLLAGRQERCLAALLTRPEWANALAALRMGEANQPDDRMELQRQVALGAIRNAQGSLAERLASLACLARIDLRGGRQGAWPGGKAQLDEIRAALRSLRVLWRRDAGLLELALTPLDEELALAFPALRATFAHACRRMDIFKDERNALDFDDLERRALVLLEQDAAVCTRWSGEIRALLVDEFQDTNGRQRDLVTLLNGGQGKLFIVGDAKQSIYRFRGADVTVFRDERGVIEGQGGVAFALDTSYRAHRELIQGLNELLRPVLGVDEDPARPWVEPFASLLHHREEPGPGFITPYIELHLVAGTKAEGALDRAAGALAGRIVELVAGGAQVSDDTGGTRPLDYGDFAILCRASGSFAAYEDALERAAVPFLTVAGRGFYGRPEIRDVLNVLHALADPTDDLALVGLLRSPAFGLSDAALYALCRERDQAESAASLWATLGAPSRASLGDDGPKATRAVCIIADLHGRVGRISVADLLKAFLDATDYRAALIQSAQSREQSGGAEFRGVQSRGTRNLAKLLGDAHASGIVGVGEFLEYVAGLRDSGTREGEARAAAEGAVQIMSVHMAKGLEFPVVVIGDVAYGRRGPNRVLVDPDLGVLLPLKDEDDRLSAVYRLGQALNDDQEAAELDRLLYVATTRAREKLLISGCIRLNKGGAIGKQAGWLETIGGPEGLALAETAVSPEQQGAGVVHLDLRAGHVPVSCTIYPPPSTEQSPAQSRHPSGGTPQHRELDEPGYGRDHRSGGIGTEAAVPLPPPLLAPVTFGKEVVDQRTRDQERDPPQRAWRVVPPATSRPRAPAREIGLIVHEALAAWRFPDTGFERWARARARAHGLTDARELDEAVRQSRLLLVRFRNHPLFQEMDAAERRLHEVPYSLMVDGSVERRIIDALYLKDGVWTIIEFKTGEFKDEADFQRRLKEEDYLGQARRYLDAVRRLLGRPPRCFLCLLNCAQAVHRVPVPSLPEKKA